MKRKELVKAITDYIEAAPLHSRAIISTLVSRFDPEREYSEEFFFAVQQDVKSRLQKNGKRWLDYSEYDNMLVGMPFNLDAVIRDSKTEPQIFVIDDRLPKL